MTTDKAYLEAALTEYERRYHWFRSPNVVDLDKIRRLKSQPQPRELTHDPQGRTHA
jgi:thioester reductase-like protein